MIIEKNYRLNKKTGNILNSERIEVKCDSCEKRWSCLYKGYKRKKLDKDYCIGCRNSLGICGVKGGHSEDVRKAWSENGIKSVRNVNVSCAFCNSPIKNRKYTSKIAFCSTDCRYAFDNKNRYEHIINDIDYYIDEWSYIVGLIMGDGNVKNNKSTSRINICFNEREKESIKCAKSLLEKLKIKYNVNTRGNYSVVVIDFSLSNDVLDMFDINYRGSKYASQPCPNAKIVNNINYLSGLINSDGYYAIRKSGSHYIQITNVTKSIIKSAKLCLDKHGFKYRVSKYNNKNNNEKLRYDLFISGKDKIYRLKKLLKFKIKEPSSIL